MRYFIVLVFISSFFSSCHKKEYNEQELIKAFVNHSYNQYSENDIKEYLKKGPGELKKIDKKFEIVSIKGKRVKKKDSKPNKEFFYPFILKKDNNSYLILKVFDYSIAYEAGLKPGILKSVNNKDISNYEPCKLEKEIRDSRELSLSFNDGKGDWSINVKKEISAFPFVWSVVLNDNAAYVNILSLSANSANYFKNNVTNLKKRGIKKLILDLRDVSSGNYDEAAKIIGYFSKDKKTYYIKSSKKGYSKDFKIEENPFADMKLAVLVNKNTALLGEVIAASLKENGALVVGEKTKGEVYITRLFKVGNDTSAVLTIAKLYPPSGKDLDEGIIPDYQSNYDYSKMALTYVINCDSVISKAAEML